MKMHQTKRGNKEDDRMRSRYQHVWRNILIIAVVLALTAGCSSNNGASTVGETNTNKPSNSPANDTESKGKDKPEPVTITIWDQPKGDATDKEVIEQKFRDFEAKYDYITVEHKLAPTGNEARKAFVTAMAGGSGPDAYQSTPFPIMGDWIRQGFALDLTSYWDNFEEKDQFIPSSLDAATVDGKLYGIPQKMYVAGLIWNKKLFKEAGLDPNAAPKDWAEFAEYAKKLTIPEKQQYGYALLGMEWADWHFEYYVWQAGGDLTSVNGDGTVNLRFTEEPVVAALEYYRDLKFKHKVLQKDVLQDIGTNNTDFNNGRTAMMLQTSDGFSGLVKSGFDLNDVGFAPLPVGPSGESPSQVGGSYWIINPKSSKAKQDAAWKYVTFMSSKDVQEKELQFRQDNGMMQNLLSVRKDVNPLDYTDGLQQDLVNGVLKAAEHTQLEYYLKERLTPYIVKVIQMVLTDENTDIRKELQIAQDTAQREVVDPYNEEVKQ
jgi:ABC-type glycerol-3-phosphate transport system substrate-binding protein